MSSVLLVQSKEYPWIWGAYKDVISRNTQIGTVTQRQRGRSVYYRIVLPHMRNPQGSNTPTLEQAKREIIRRLVAQELTK